MTNDVYECSFLPVFPRRSLQWVSNRRTRFLVGQCRPNRERASWNAKRADGKCCEADAWSLRACPLRMELINEPRTSRRREQPLLSSFSNLLSPLACLVVDIRSRSSAGASAAVWDRLPKKESSAGDRYAVVRLIWKSLHSLPPIESVHRITLGRRAPGSHQGWLGSGTRTRLVETQSLLFDQQQQQQQLLPQLDPPFVPVRAVACRVFIKIHMRDELNKERLIWPPARPQMLEELDQMPNDWTARSD